MRLAWKYLLTSLLVLAGLLVRLALGDELVPVTFLFYLPAIALGTFLFGSGTGIYATVLSTALSVYFLFEPRGSFAIGNPGAGLGALLFMAVSLALVILAGGIIEGLLKALKREERHALHLRELRHRARNNLQIMAALLMTQARTTPVPEAAEELRAAAGRVAAMSRIQDRLEASGDGRVSMHAFLDDLAAELRLALLDLRPVALRIEADGELGSDRAAIVGLIVNELVTNAVKYAFPGEREGTIAVRFHREGPDFVLSVADDGVGLAPDARLGLGSRLLKAFTLQLGGSFGQGPGPGACWAVRFPAADPRI